MKDVTIGGVFLSPIVLTCALALVATVLLSWVLTRIGFYRLTWHRPLVEVSMFCIAVGLITLVLIHR